MRVPPSARLRHATSALRPQRGRDFTGRTCSHCGGPQIGMASITQDGQYRPVCHPDYGMNCYELVTIHGHSMPCNCRGSSEHPDNDPCARCEYRRFEHPIDPAQPRRFDFLGNPVPCWQFLESTPRDPFADLLDEEHRLSD